MTKEMSEDSVPDIDKKVYTAQIACQTSGTSITCQHYGKRSIVDA